MCERWGNKEIRFKGSVGPDNGGPKKPGRVFELDSICGQLGATLGFSRGNSILPSQSKKGELTREWAGRLAEVIQTPSSPASGLLTGDPDK